MASPQRLALFDLDHTLLPQDTQALFARFVFSRHPWRRLHLLLYGLCLFPALLGFLDTRAMKRVFFGILRGMTPDEVRDLAVQFARDLVPRGCYPELLSELERLRSEGFTLVLNSASPEFYVEAIGRELGFDHTVGTPLVLENPIPLIPKIDGPNNKHGQKLTAMMERGIIERNEVISGCWAFSDSRADLPLLGLAENPVAIHPAGELLRVATSRGWRILTPTRSYHGPVAQWTETLRHTLGLGSPFPPAHPGANAPGSGSGPPQAG